jgi:8-oxo-dGTP diphosphatase
MVVAFVRHAHAGSRSAWTDDDKARPLSPKGQSQATGLVAVLRPIGITELLSSPYLRCVQTLEPLAEATGLPVTVDTRLAEDTPFEVTLSLLDHVTDGAVLCSHGDVIPATLDALVRRGLTIDGPRSLKKGSAYLLHRSSGRFSHADYVPPPAVD